MFAGSSLHQNRPNADGSYNVFCFQCNQFISTSFTHIHRSLCYLCQCSEEGKILTPEDIAKYQVSKSQRGDVNFLTLPEVAPEGSVQKRQWSLSSVTGNMMRAVGRFAQSAIGKVQEANKLPSAVTAREKRRGRLFSNIDLSALGKDKK